MPDTLTLQELRVRTGDRLLVEEASLQVVAGRITALVGASGSGKTLTARSLLGLVDLKPGVEVTDYVVCWDEHTLRPYQVCKAADRRARDAAFAPLRGAVLGYLPQNAVAALDPLLKVGPQVAAAAALRKGWRFPWRRQMPDPSPWLASAGLHEPRVADLYPHELSGGMAQRVVIAQALARGSRFLVADEPTTALDPTVQAAVLLEIRRLADAGLGVLLITHDLRILPELADEVLVMQGGRLVEQALPGALAAGRLTTDHGARLLAATRKVSGGRLG